MNVIYSNVVDTSFKYYNLYSTGKCLQLQLEDLQKINKELKNDKIASFLDEVVQESKEHCKELDWSKFDLVKARPFKGSYGNFAPPEYIIVSSKHSRTKQRTEYNRQDSVIRNWKRENYSYFNFSKPTFSKDKKFVIILLQSHYGYKDPMRTACYYIFEHVENTWRKLYEGSCIEFTSYR